MARQSFFARQTAERKAIVESILRLAGYFEQEQLRAELAEEFKLSLDNFEKVQRLLPFHTDLKSGNNFVHIVNKGANAIKTDKYVVWEGDTLCRRTGRLYDDVIGLECPGCLAIGAGLAVREK